MLKNQQSVVDFIKAMKTKVSLLLSSLFLIVSLGSVKGVTYYKEQAELARIVQWGERFAQLSEAFKAYEEKYGHWPSSQQKSGSIPAGMAPFLSRLTGVWRAESALGGHYYWSYQELHRGRLYRAVIALEDYQREDSSSLPLARSLDDWIAIDAVIDDGNVNTGSLRLGRRDYPVWIVAE